MKITSIHKSELYDGTKNRRRLHRTKTATTRAVKFNDTFQDVFEMSSEAENHFKKQTKEKVYKKTNR